MLNCRCSRLWEKPGKTETDVSHAGYQTELSTHVRRWDVHSTTFYILRLDLNIIIIIIWWRRIYGDNKHIEGSRTICHETVRFWQSQVRGLPKDKTCENPRRDNNPGSVYILRRWTPFRWRHIRRHNEGKTHIRLEVHYHVGLPWEYSLPRISFLVSSLFHA